MDMYVILFKGGGLKGIQDNLISNWIGPAFFILVAVFAIYFVKEQQFRRLIAFVGIAIIVGILIFYGDKLFGKDGKLVEEGKNTLNVQTILPIPVKGIGTDLLNMVP